MPSSKHRYTWSASSKIAKIECCMLVMIKIKLYSYMFTYHMHIKLYAYINNCTICIFCIKS